MASACSATQAWAMSSISVFLVDDHQIVRRGLADLIDDENDLTIVGEAGSVRDALIRVPLTKPDVVVVDVRLPDGDGLELCRALRATDPDIRCVVLTAFSDPSAHQAAWETGVSGYLIKDANGTKILNEIRGAARSGHILKPAPSCSRNHYLQDPDPENELTAREREILRLVAQGLTNKEIGARLDISEKTVRNRVSGILAKLEVTRRSHAIAWALRHHAEWADGD